MKIGFVIDIGFCNQPVRVSKQLNRMLNYLFKENYVIIQHF